MTRLAAEQLACERGGRDVFADVSFQLHGGESLLLTGPNGSGKTTLMRALCGLSEITQGKLELRGFPGDLPIPQRSHYVGHQEAIKVAFTVTENLQFWASFLGGGNVALALEAFGLARLGPYSAGLLSSGQRRRLALSRLLLVKRPIWLLDEPTVGLDAASQAVLGDLLTAHLADGGMVIVSSHVDLPLTPSLQLDMAEHAVLP
ncbi:heme exporter protein A [Rhodoligotrophos appendicifer]|uniref:heme ABC exporter ATP-binding protein CcmA n=1 Tax=Rhodoligotrophos appendicifer TaxID=987056 RepID=UPI001186F92F|nr:heme ABC exporter ATP-binding protein CcmA [Rhodoligotrophos appendicifer]